MRNVHVISRSVGFGRSAISVAVFDEIHMISVRVWKPVCAIGKNAVSLPLTTMLGLGRRAALALLRSYTQ